MVVNAIPTKEGSPSGAASPVVSGQVPKASSAPQAVASAPQDVVELSSAGVSSAAESAIVARSRENIGSGSRVYRDEATAQYVIQIVNDSNEVIRQLPPEEALRIAQRFREITGILFDERA